MNELLAIRIIVTLLNPQQLIVNVGYILFVITLKYYASSNLIVFNHRLVYRLVYR